MEFLSSKVSFGSHLLPSTPFIKCKNPSRLIVQRKSFTKFTLNPSYSLYIFSAGKFQISARLGRHSTRENYLRKKLTRQPHQLVGQLQNPVHDLLKENTCESNVDDSHEKKVGHDKSNSLDENPNSSVGESEKHGFEKSDNLSSRKQFGESIMWNKLESWVEQYKKDSEFWGIGAGPIFTVYQDSQGTVEKVVVNEEEIFRRSRVDPRLSYETEDMDEAKFKISFAKDLAREMENGSNVIPKQSSVAKFLVSGEKSRYMETFSGKSRIMEAIKGKSNFTEMINSVMLKPGLLPRIYRFGGWLFCGLFVVWAVRGIFSVWCDIDQEYTKSEKKMLQRKMKARAEKEKTSEGIMEVLPALIEPKSMPFNRPQLDKEELMSGIVKAKGSKNELEIRNQSGYQNEQFRDKIEEIRIMAREAREADKRNHLLNNENVEGSQALEEFFSNRATPGNGIENESEVSVGDFDEITESAYSMDLKTESEVSVGVAIAEASTEKTETQLYNIPNANTSHSLKYEVGEVKLTRKSSELNEEDLSSDVSKVSSSDSSESFPKKKLKIITSAKEAREYLLRKHKTLEVKQNCVATNDSLSNTDLTEEVGASSLSSGVDDISSLSSYSKDIQRAEVDIDDMDDLQNSRISSAQVSISNHVAVVSDNTEIGTGKEQIDDLRNGISSSVGEMLCSTPDGVNGGVETEKVFVHSSNHNSEATVSDENLAQTTDGQYVGETTKPATSVKKEKWIEKNYHEIEPIVRKMAVGFRENYLAAREKASEGLDLVSDYMPDSGESDLEWMKDEKLRETVFKVRDNELSGRDPFHLMSEEDKVTFFGGLEKKVEQVNENLQKLHEYFHSNIENLDYGADGISLYDPPEKIIPRWKVPPAEKNPEFLNNFTAQRESFIAEGVKNSFLSNKTVKDNLEESKEVVSSSSDEKLSAATDLSHQIKNVERDSSVSSRTVIEGTDGSVKPGKETGREFWQHTKKWSQGFLESYNAETDPEVKSEMRNIGKDLDRWITEKEIQEAAELMEKIPKKGRNFINKKLEKVKREMELFGPQAVVSKYREYSDEKEEDYLWWLDLPHVLCIELYTVEGGEQRVGFYSLEMATDLELNPKQYHVIAFEDAGDCKNMCYIIQSHMEMLGNGHAFVVARPPKDAFREAKSNGFSVTVVRKGQLQLNIDQTLEEVEESIVEIGSKIYHDKITKERGVDINALMKGVFGVSKPAKRKRSKLRMNRRIKP